MVHVNVWSNTTLLTALNKTALQNLFYDHFTIKIQLSVHIMRGGYITHPLSIRICTGFHESTIRQRYLACYVRLLSGICLLSGETNTCYGLDLLARLIHMSIADMMWATIEPNQYYMWPTIKLLPQVSTRTSHLHCESVLKTKLTTQPIWYNDKKIVSFRRRFVRSTVLCALRLGKLAGRPNDGQTWCSRGSDGREGGFLQSPIGEGRVSWTGWQMGDRQKQYSKHEGKCSCPVR